MVIVPIIANDAVIHPPTFSQEVDFGLGLREFSRII